MGIWNLPASADSFSPNDSPAHRGCHRELLREVAGRDGLRPDAVHVQRVSDVVIAPEPFGGGNGMLTSQFKLQRRRIAEAYLRATARSGS
jgi:hypothetical protein